MTKRRLRRIRSDRERRIARVEEMIRRRDQRAEETRRALELLRRAGKESTDERSDV